jgi:hypothetical protein
MADNKQGYVYILTNPSFKNDWVKIGKSVREVNVRSKELDNTAVPLPFSIFATLKTKKYNEAEKFIHKMIDMVAPDIRIRKGREFFNITPIRAYEILRLCAEQYDDAEAFLYDDGEVVDDENGVITDDDSKKQRRKPLTFEMIDIPVGAELEFVEKPDIKVIVVDKLNTVRVGDLEVSISAAARELKRQFGTANVSGAYRGGMYFSYNAEKLTDIRKRLGR